jgi:hypothetical protein
MVDHLRETSGHLTYKNVSGTNHLVYGCPSAVTCDDLWESDTTIYATIGTGWTNNACEECVDVANTYALTPRLYRTAQEWYYHGSLCSSLPGCSGTLGDVENGFFIKAVCVNCVWTLNVGFIRYFVGNNFAQYLSDASSPCLSATPLTLDKVNELTDSAFLCVGLAPATVTLNL